MKPTCSAEGCSAAATHIFNLSVWPANADKAIAPHAEFELYVPICRQHGLKATLSDILSEQGWQGIADSLPTPPCRETAEMRLIELKVH